MEIRLFGPDDAGRLAAASSALFDDPLVPERAAEYLADPRHHLAVALDGDALVGFASGVHYVHPDKRLPELWINEVGVNPSHRRRGLGQALIGALLDEARRLGCAEAWVLTDRANRAASRLYDSLGGVEEETVMYSFSLTERAPVS